MRENGFVNVKTIEIVDNKKNVKTFSMPLPDFGLELEELIEADIIPDVRNSSSGYLSKVSQFISDRLCNSSYREEAESQSRGQKKRGSCLRVITISREQLDGGVNMHTLDILPLLRCHLKVAKSHVLVENIFRDEIWAVGRLRIVRLHLAVALMSRNQKFILGIIDEKNKSSTKRNSKSQTKMVKTARSIESKIYHFSGTSKIYKLSDVDNLPMTIEDCQNTIVLLFGVAKTIIIDNCDNLLVVAFSSDSTYIRNST